ncbi:LuxR C-terminal-related transcriptional regulator [Micromonospora sp. DT48]|uniref:helix-turn-helix transcriptional regulator n=1 Tax=Micromonospora sp. DT48 TaxID=3393429 RepID=UPI003CF553AC
MSMLAGRDEELAMVRAVLAVLVPRRPTLVEITGDPGAGKTAFLTHLLRHLPSEFHVDLTAHRWTPAALARLGRLSRVRPVVAVLDDAHRAEPAVAALRRLLGDAAPPGRLAVVCAYRPRQASRSLLHLLSDLGAGIRQMAVPLGALPEETADALLPSELPAARRATLAAVGGRLPGLLAVLAAHPDLVDTDGSVALERVAEIGPSKLLAGLLGPETDLADQSTRRALHAMAVLGEAADPALVAEVGQQRRAAAVEALDRLVRMDLLRYGADESILRPRHALVRAAAYQDAPVGWRARAHLRADAVLRRRGADPRIRGWHLFQAGRAATRHRGINNTAHELLTLDPAMAARLARLAATVVPPNDSVALGDVLLTEARATAAAGDLTGALRLAEAAHGAPPGPDTRLASAVLRADLADRLGTGVPALARLAGEHATTVERLRPQLSVAQGRLAARHGRWDDLNPLVSDIQAATEMETNPPLAAVARTTLAARAAAHGVTDVAGSELRAAEALVDAMSDRALAGCLDVPEWLAWVQGTVLDKEGALRHLTRAVALAREHGQAHVLPGLLAGHARIAAASGRLDEAISVAIEAERAGRSVGARPAVTIALTYRAMALLWHAGPKAAAPVGEQAVREARQDPTLYDIAVAVLSHIRYAQGRHAEARHLTSVLVQPGRMKFRRRDMQPKWLAGHAEFLVAGGLIDEAYAWSQRAEEAAAALGLEVRQAEAHLATASVLLARRNPADALVAAQRATELLADRQADLSLGQAHVAVADCLEALGESGPAREHIHLARSLAERLSSAWLLQQVVNAQRRHGAGQRRWSAAAGPDLTQAEHRVAVLVAEGLTNRAVAMRLYVTERTVEAHLTRVYRKLGVSSRATLAALLRDGGGVVLPANPEA